MADFQESFNKINNTPDNTSNFDPKDIEDNRLVAILSYLSILVVFPLLRKESKFARFHANQGLVLLIVEIVVLMALAIVTGIFSIIQLGFIIDIIEWLFRVLILVLAIIGIINTYNGKAKELPIIGKFKILKD